MPPVNNKPDVVAPAHYPRMRGDAGLEISEGTSWSTPIVTATVANVIPGLREQGETPPPYLIRRGLREGATPTEDVPVDLFSSTGTFEHVCSELGCSFSSEEPDVDFDLL